MLNILSPRSDLLDYIGKHYQPKDIYLSAAGGIDHAELVKLAEKHFGGMQTTHDYNSSLEYPPARYSGSLVSVRWVVRYSSSWL